MVNGEGTTDIEVDSQDRIVRVRNGANYAIMGEYVYDEGGFHVRKSARFVKANVTQDVEILYPGKFYGLEYSSEANTLSSVNNIYLNGVRIAAAPGPSGRRALRTVVVLNSSLYLAILNLI